MNRLHIAIILMLVLVTAALGASYQFYFKEKFQEYNQAEEDLKNLTSRLVELQKRFKGQQPEEFLRNLSDSIAPLTDAADIRSKYFNMNDIWKDELVPEDVNIPLKFYYDRQYKERYLALQQDALTHVPPLAIPLDVFQSFGAPDPASTANMAVLKKDVEKWLTQMNFAAAVTRILIKANAGGVVQVLPWPPRVEFGCLEMRTVGLVLYFKAEDLVSFVQGLQRDNRYFNINALRIKNRNLLSDPAYGPPYLEVEMLLTFSRYLEDKKPAGSAAAAAAGPGGASLANIFGGGGGGSGVRLKKASKPWWKKLWPF